MPILPWQVAVFSRQGILQASARSAESGTNVPSPAPTKNALLSTDKGAFFELSVPQAEREVSFGREVHFVREVCLWHDKRNT